MAVDAPDAQIDEGSSSARGQRQQRLEVAVFLFLVVPSLVLSLFAIRQGILNFVVTAAAIICRDLSLISLILFFLWRNGKALTQIGWNFRCVAKELILGAVPVHSVHARNGRA